MFITNHALAGAAIGLAGPRPGTAFAAGVASHVAMDVVLHWGDDLSWDEFVQVARVDGTVGLAVCAALLVAAPARRRAAVAAGIAGACLIDMDKPGRHFLGRSPFPAAVDRFHGRIQNEHPLGRLVEAATAGALVAGLLLLRGRTRA
ncbi:MAG TPA: hypothetical protein VFZ77_11700 [Acidimicrobiales bacterium]